MRVQIRVVTAGEPPPTGAPLTVEIRDVSMADAASVTVAHADTVVEAAPAPDDHSTLGVVEVDVDDDLLAGGRDLNVWARVAASGEPRVAAGDWITMRSHPLRPSDAEAPLDVEVRPVEATGR